MKARDIQIRFLLHFVCQRMRNYRFSEASDESFFSLWMFSIYSCNFISLHASQIILSFTNVEYSLIQRETGFCFSSQPSAYQIRSAEFLIIDRTLNSQRCNWTANNTFVLVELTANPANYQLSSISWILIRTINWNVARAVSLKTLSFHRLRKQISWELINDRNFLVLGTFCRYPTSLLYYKMT